MSLEVLVEAAERIRADAAADHLRLAELPIAGDRLGNRRP